jgi:hypothetical protein
VPKYSFLVDVVNRGFRKESPMSGKAVDIGRFVRVPMTILKAKISPRAREVWMILASNCSPEKPFAWARQASVAEDLNCSTDTVGRALKKLIKAGLIAETGRWHWGRYKIYEIAWTNPLQEHVPHIEEITSCILEPEELTELQEHVPQKSPNITRVGAEQKKNFSKGPATCTTTADELLSCHGEEWTNSFECLDGNSGRPSIETCVKEAMNHTARHKCDDLKIYIDGWLRNATKMWKNDFYREQTLPASDPSLSPEVVARKVREDAQRKWSYQQAIASPADAEKYKPKFTEEDFERGRKWLRDNGFKVTF